jgi:type IV pilus assembly protein PilW
MNRKYAPYLARGMSLIELMIALLISAVIIFGATTVYNQSRRTYGESESVARLQETARYAMSIIEPDVRMSNYFGLVKGASVLMGQAAQTDAAVGTAAQNICGDNFAIDLDNNLQGDNNGYVLSATRKAGCDALTDLNTNTVWTTNSVLSADTLTVRRASTVFPVTTANGVLQICSSRVAGRLYSDGSACTADPMGRISNLLVNAYYVDQASQQRATLPSLRRKVLTSLAGAVRFADQEVIAGVEDMQIQFGIDPNGLTGIATRYVNPDGVPAGAQVVAVRVWLLVRSDVGEPGFTDSRIYEYGDRLVANGTTGNLNAAAGIGRAYQPSLSADTSMTGPQHTRRLLISRWPA